MSNPEQYEEQAFNLMEECPDECKRFMLQLSSENSKLKKELKKMKAFAAAINDLVGLTPEDLWLLEKKPLYSGNPDDVAFKVTTSGDASSGSSGVVRRARVLELLPRILSVDGNFEKCFPEANC